MEICCEEGVAGLEISGKPLDRGVGEKYIKMCKDAGVKMMHKVGAVRHARHAINVGYDAIMAAGIEEGGHPLDDDVSSMVLTNKMCQTYPDVPIITVGGIADGRGLAAALALGDDAVMMASRFVITQECFAHDRIKQELCNREEMDTMLVMKTLGVQGRVLKNKVVADILEIENRDGGIQELMPLISGERNQIAWNDGDVDLSMIMVGQSIGLCHDVPTCQELLDRMIVEAENAMNSAMAKFH